MCWSISTSVINAKLAVEGCMPWLDAERLVVNVYESLRAEASLINATYTMEQLPWVLSVSSSTIYSALPRAWSECVAVTIFSQRSLLPVISVAMMCFSLSSLIRRPRHPCIMDLVSASALVEIQKLMLKSMLIIGAGHRPSTLSAR
eukprot:scaffold62088_cov18-Prasinocladus_malaysianus.AAC.1